MKIRNIFLAAAMATGCGANTKDRPRMGIDGGIPYPNMRIFPEECSVIEVNNTKSYASSLYDFQHGVVVVNVSEVGALTWEKSYTAPISTLPSAGRKRAVEMFNILSLVQGTEHCSGPEFSVTFSREETAAMKNICYNQGC